MSRVEELKPYIITVDFVWQEMSAFTGDGMLEALDWLIGMFVNILDYVYKYTRPVTWYVYKYT